MRKTSLHFLESYYINCKNYCLLFLSPQARKVLWILSFFNSQGKSSAPSIIWNRKIIATVPVIQIPHLGLYQTLVELLKTWRVSELETMSDCEPQVGFSSFKERCSVQIRSCEILHESIRNQLFHKPNKWVIWTSAPEWGCGAGSTLQLLFSQLCTSQWASISKHTNKPNYCTSSGKLTTKSFFVCPTSACQKYSLHAASTARWARNSFLSTIRVTSQRISFFRWSLRPRRMLVQWTVDSYTYMGESGFSSTDMPFTPWRKDKPGHHSCLSQREMMRKNFTVPVSHCHEPGRKEQKCSLAYLCSA